MKSLRLRIAAASVFTLVIGAAMTTLMVSTPAARADCQPVACPAIAKICPQGQIACRVSECNCALACTAEGHGCQIP